jgi:hypothetical protein
MYKLTRERDNLTKYGEVVKYVEWNEDGRFSKLFDEPMIGRSIIINPHYMVYTWLTTEITSFEYDGDVLKFDTKNSKYILEKIKSE